MKGCALVGSIKSCLILSSILASLICEREGYLDGEVDDEPKAREGYDIEGDVHPCQNPSVPFDFVKSLVKHR